MIPRLPVGALVCLAWVGLCAATAASDRGGPPRAPQLILTLVHRVQLGARSPAQRLPSPAVIAADVIPPILTTDRDVRFLRPDGSLARRIRLDDDPNLAKSAVLSPGGQYVTITSTFSQRAAEQILGENAKDAEGGEFAMSFAVHDRSGQRQYTTTGVNDDIPQLTDAGCLFLSNFHSGELIFVDRSTGQTRKTTQPISGGPPEIAVSDDGQRVFVGINRVSVDGSFDRRVVHRSTQRFLERGIRSAWAAMYDGTGRRLWMKQLPEATVVQGVGISGDGRYAFVSAEKHTAGPLTSDVLEGSPAYILDGGGNIVASGGELKGFGMGPFRFDLALQAFVSGDDQSGFYVIGFLDGRSRAINALRLEPDDSGDLNVRARCIGSRFHGLLGLIKRRVLLLLLDQTGRPLARKTIHAGRWNDDDERGGDGDREGDRAEPRKPRPEPKLGLTLSADGRFATVRIDDELRTYEIRERHGGDRK